MLIEPDYKGYRIHVQAKYPMLMGRHGTHPPGTVER